MTRKLTLILPLLLLQLALTAQERKPVEMSDLMHQNGKIYVVVAVILTIFAGIILYLVRLDRKISKLEKNQHS
jgi:hypothetical protein